MEAFTLKRTPGTRAAVLRCITASMQIQFVGAKDKYLLKKAVCPNPRCNSRSVIELGYNYPREMILTYSQRVKRGVHNSSRGKGCWLHCVVEIWWHHFYAVIMTTDVLIFPLFASRGWWNTRQTYFLWERGHSIIGTRSCAEGRAGGDLAAFLLLCIH